MVAFACGSRSISTTRRPAIDKPCAKWMAVVVFPTPPFWFANTMERNSAPHLDRNRLGPSRHPDASECRVGQRNAKGFSVGPTPLTLGLQRLTLRSIVAVKFRLIGLALLVRLRGAGVMPWFLLATLLAWTAAQEPMILRDFGIRLLDGALLFGCFMASFATLASADCAIISPRERAQVDAAQLVGMACVVLSLGALCDWVLPSPHRSPRAGELALRFLTAAAGPTLAFSLRAGVSQIGPGCCWAWALCAATGALGIRFSTSEPSFATVGASVLCVAAAIIASNCSEA
jgi:hypothetical protein